MSSTILDDYVNYLLKPEGEERTRYKNLNICLQIEMLTQKWSRRNDLSPFLSNFLKVKPERPNPIK